MSQRSEVTGVAPGPEVAGTLAQPQEALMRRVRTSGEVLGIPGGQPGFLCQGDEWNRRRPEVGGPAHDWTSTSQSYGSCGSIS